jgi:hypothetical protein
MSKSAVSQFFPVNVIATELVQHLAGEVTYNKFTKRKPAAFRDEMVIAQRK